MPDFLGRLRTPRLAAAPSSPVVGELYYDTGTNTLYWWNGTAWVPAQSGSAFSPGSWVNMPPGTNWVSNDITTVARYRKDTAGVVHWDGAMRNTAAFTFAGTNQIFAVLGVGYRPQQTLIFPHIIVDPTNGPRVVCVQVNTDGNCYIIAAGSASTGVNGTAASVMELALVTYLAA